MKGQGRAERVKKEIRPIGVVQDKQGTFNPPKTPQEDIAVLHGIRKGADFRGRQDMRAHHHKRDEDEKGQREENPFPHVT